MSSSESDPAIVIETLLWQPELQLPEVKDARWHALNAHRGEWISAVASGLKHQAYLIQAKQNQEVVGVLPLCFVKGPVFGKFLASLPYLNTGGVVCQNQEIAQQLVEAACLLADQLDVKHLELRHECPVESERFNMTRTDKVHLRLELPESPEALLKSLKSKVRSQVKKSNQSELTFEFGGRQLLSDFYRVFAVNMRDLGTPVFSKKLFAEILRLFGSDAELCIVRSAGKAIAGGLLVHSGDTTEVPSASCLRNYNRLNANMFMYEKLLYRAIERGSKTFDFGRSSEDSGTYKFKKQWGAEPSPATWQYYVRKGNPEDMRPDSGGKQRLIQVWQRLPVWLTKLIGPTVVRGIP